MQHGLQNTTQDDSVWRLMNLNSKAEIGLDCKYTEEGIRG